MQKSDKNVKGRRKINQELRERQTGAAVNFALLESKFPALSNVELSVGRQKQHFLPLKLEPRELSLEQLSLGTTSSFGLFSPSFSSPVVK
ncbi:hypothetical protein AVEN_25093-1 [Araneus ventricosus]|uniref:Uncharacterized protein n=1 Tax=Araneus ventricosus TaxID=182803 RepID=A0A4Y2JEP4_ARAVE|nr:hypothetical protein AVEN_25093-1 [Araneus ventricosus]